uniref:Apoptosis and caspase activation inhibitor n=1 Tax=Sphenodon punctatus TaxID=8508 RepID=A0A8D0HS97_SPHPU
QPLHPTPTPPPKPGGTARSCINVKMTGEWGPIKPSPGVRDSFTQFRFTDEKEWDTENVYPKQLSGLYVDCQNLVQALQELPLDLRLNVAAELVQTTPVELPRIKSKRDKDTKRSGILLQQPLGQGGITSVSSDPGTDSLGHLMPLSKDGLGIISPEHCQQGSLVSHQETDHLDEELDLLLNLDAPVNAEDNFLMEIPSHDITSERDLEMQQEENAPLKRDVTEEKSPASEQPQTTSKNVTEEELEDWLDSMIS